MIYYYRNYTQLIISIDLPRKRSYGKMIQLEDKKEEHNVSIKYEKTAGSRGAFRAPDKKMESKDGGVYLH
jgi:hypothetical protein